MTDRELLELAAKSEGRTVKLMTQIVEGRESEEFIACWNPLTDDGDALRLAVKLKIETKWLGGDAWAWTVGKTAISKAEPIGDCPFAATRRAIVRAAAEIGKTMK